MPYFDSQYNQSPVRAEVEGVQVENNIRYNFKTVYDYHEFRPSIDNYAMSYFEVRSKFNILQNKKKIGFSDPKRCLL